MTMAQSWKAKGRSYSVLKRHANSYLSGKVSGSCHVCKNGKSTDYFKAVQYLIGIDVGSGKAFQIQRWCPKGLIYSDAATKNAMKWTEVGRNFQA